MSFLFGTSNTVATPQSMLKVPGGPTADAGSACVPAKDSKELSTSSDFKLESLPSSLMRTALRACLGKPTRASHAGRGIDVYPVSLNVTTGITADASGNGYNYFNASGFTASGRWSSLYPLFDLVRVKKVVFRFVPWLGVNTVRALTPATATSPLVFRCAMDPDGALSAPSAAQLLALQEGAPHFARTWPIYQDHVYTYKPIPLLRFSGGAMTKTTLAEWHDCGDVNSSSSTTVVGGIICGNVASGAFPASTNVIGMMVEYHLEFAGLI